MTGGTLLRRLLSARSQTITLLRPRAALRHVRAVGTIAAGHGVSRGLSLLTFLLLSRWMTPADFGQLNVGVLLAATITQGPTSLDTGYVALFHAPGVDRRDLAYSYRGLSSVIAVAAVAAAVVVGVATRGSSYGLVLALGVAYAGLYTLFLDLPTDLQARGRFVGMSAWLAALPAAVLAATALLRRAGHLDAAVVLATWLGLLAVFSVVSFAAVGGPLRPLRWPGAIVRRLLRLSSWLVVATAAFALSMRLEVFLVAALLSDVEVGHYAAAIRYAGLMEILTVSFTTFAVQRATSQRDKDDRRVAAELLRPGMAIVGAGVVVALVAPLGVPLLFGDAYVPAVGPARVLVAAQIPLVAAVAASGLLYRHEATRTVAVASAAGLAAKAASGVPLIMVLDTTGAAWSAVIAATVVAGSMWWGLRTVVRPSPVAAGVA